MDMYRFNSFTQKANDVLNLAIKAAENYGHTYIGTEHMLIGVLKENTSYGAQLLAEKGVTLDKIEELLRDSVGVGDPTALSPADFTPTAKRVLEVSFQLARGMRNSFVGTEHLLLALLRESDSAAVKLLSACSVDAQSFTEELVNDLARPEAEFRGSKSAKRGKSKTPTLDEFGTDLTEKARDGGIDPVIGRDKEIERVIQILSRRTKNNPCLIGEPGVGKTAIAEGLALKIVKDEVPELLAGKKIVALDLTSMVAGTKYRGDFEERIKKAMDEVKAAKDVILFIDEVHTLIGAGAAEGAVETLRLKGVFNPLWWASRPRRRPLRYSRGFATNTRRTTRSRYPTRR